MTKQDRDLTEFDRILKNWTRRQFIQRSGGAIGLSALIAGVMNACTTPPTASPPPGTTVPGQAASPTETPIRGGTLVEGAQTDPASLNTVRFPQVSAEGIVRGYMFDGLLANTPTGELIPAIAQALPLVSSDSLTYTFDLRKDAKWTDGKPVTADDVVFTYKLMFDPAYKDVISAFRGELQGNLASVTATDPYTVVFRTNQIYAGFLALHARHGILPKHVLGSLSPTEFNTSKFHEEPSVTNGAFKFVTRQKGDYITMARNESYYAGPPYLEQLIAKGVRDVTSYASQLKTGEIHAAKWTQARAIEELSAVPTLNVGQLENYPQIQTLAFQLDPARPASKSLSDPAVRRALYWALDREGIVKAVYGGIGARVQDQIWWPSSWAYNPSPSITYGYDPKKAAQILNDAGWKVGPSGVREKDGVQLTYEYLDSGGEHTLTAQVMQKNWADIGVQLSIRKVTSADQTRLVTTEHNFDIARQPYRGQLDPDVSNLYHSASAQPGGENVAGYKNPEMDRLLEEAASTLDQTKRKELYDQVQEILLRDLPMAPIVHVKFWWIWNKRVRNYGYGEPGSAMGDWSWQHPRYFINKVWMAES